MRICDLTPIRQFLESLLLQASRWAGLVSFFFLTFLTGCNDQQSFSQFPVELMSDQPKQGVQESLVTLNGAHFDSRVTATMDGIPCLSLSVLNSNTMICKAPDHPIGPVDVVVMQQSGSKATLPKGFLYIDPLTILSISPNLGPSGTSVTIKGKGFGFGATVTLDDLPCLNISYIDTYTLTCVTPPHADGPVDVTVINPGLESVTLKAGYTYKAPTSSLRLIQPAVAIRGMACLMCHASITGNVITDFGYPDPWYFYDNPASWTYFSDVEYSAGWFNPFYAQGWMSAVKLAGSIYVPDALVPPNLNTAFAAAATGPAIDPAKLTIAQMLQTPYNESWTGYLSSAQVGQAISSNVTPQPPTAPKVVAYSKVTIQSPQTSDILKIAPSLAANPTQVAMVEIRAPNSTLPPLSGLAVQGTGDDQYISNQGLAGTGATVAIGVKANISAAPVATTALSGVVECYGDVVINGPVFLKDLQLKTGDAGCRLYVTGTIFVEGPIMYLTAGTSNIQMTSSRAIVMGIGYGALENRLIGDNRNPHLKNYVWSDIADDILDDASSVNVLRDSTDLAGTNYPTGLGAGGETMASINYTHIVLSAPVIQSRYLGQVQGTVIAEIALFALGEFEYQFDPIFTNISVFPLLPIDLLTLTP